MWCILNFILYYILNFIFQCYCLFLYILGSICTTVSVFYHQASLLVKFSQQHQSPYYSAIRESSLYSVKSVKTFLWKSAKRHYKIGRMVKDSEATAAAELLAWVTTAGKLDFWVKIEKVWTLRVFGGLCYIDKGSWILDW